MNDSSTTRYPNITAQLTGSDGNAFAVIGSVTLALRRAGISEDEVKAFRNEAMSADYDHLLQTAMAWVAVS